MLMDFRSAGGTGRASFGSLGFAARFLEEADEAADVEAADLLGAAGFSPFFLSRITCSRRRRLEAFKSEAGKFGLWEFK